MASDSNQQRASHCPSGGPGLRVANRTLRDRCRTATNNARALARQVFRACTWPIEPFGTSAGQQRTAGEPLPVWRSEPTHGRSNPSGQVPDSNERRASPCPSGGPGLCVADRTLRASAGQQRTASEPLPVRCFGPPSCLRSSSGRHALATGLPPIACGEASDGNSTAPGALLTSPAQPPSCLRSPSGRHSLATALPPTAIGEASGGNSTAPGALLTSPARPTRSPGSPSRMCALTTRGDR
jgi:hypothetical protein